MPLSELQPNSPSKRRTMLLHNRPQYGAVRTAGANLSPPPFQTWQETVGSMPTSTANRLPMPTATPPAARPVNHRLSRFGSAEKPHTFAGIDNCKFLPKAFTAHSPLCMPAPHHHASTGNCYTGTGGDTYAGTSNCPTATGGGQSATQPTTAEMINLLAAEIHTEIKGYVDLQKGYPSVSDMVENMELGAEKWLQTAPPTLVQLLKRIVLHGQFEGNQKQRHTPKNCTTKKRLVKVMGAVMCLVTGVHLTATLTPSFVVNAALDLWGGPQCVELVSQFFGCSAPTVKNIWAAQPADKHAGLTRQSGLVVHSSDNVGMQKMVQKFCEALKKLKIKTFTASACFLLDPSNFIQYNPYAAPPLWLYNNRYTGDPMELTVAQAEAQISERFRWLEHSMQLAAGIYAGDSSTDPWLGVAGSDPCAIKAGIKAQEKCSKSRYCHKCGLWAVAEKEGTAAPTKCKQCNSVLSKSLKASLSIRGEQQQTTWHEVTGHRQDSTLADRSYTVVDSSMLRDESDETNPQLHWSNPLHEATHRLHEKRSPPLILENPASSTVQLLLAMDAANRAKAALLGDQQLHTMDVPPEALGAVLDEAWGAAGVGTASAPQAESEQGCTAMASLSEDAYRVLLFVCYDGGIFPGVEQHIRSTAALQSLVQIYPAFHGRKLDLTTHNKVARHLGLTQFVEIHMQSKMKIALDKMLEVTNPVHKPWWCFRIWAETCIMDLVMVYMHATGLNIPGAEGNVELHTADAFEKWVQQHDPIKYEGWLFYVDLIMNVSTNLLNQYTGCRGGWKDLYFGAVKHSCDFSFAFHNVKYQSVKYDALRNLAAAKDWSKALYEALMDCTFFSESGRAQTNCGVDENMERVINLIKQWIKSGQPSERLKLAGTHCTDLNTLIRLLKQCLGMPNRKAGYGNVSSHEGERRLFRIWLQEQRMSYPRVGSLTDLFPELDHSLVGWRAVATKAKAAYHAARVDNSFKHPSPAKQNKHGMAAIFKDFFVTSEQRAKASRWSERTKPQLQAKINELHETLDGFKTNYDGIEHADWPVGSSAEVKAQQKLVKTQWAKEIDALESMIVGCVAQKERTADEIAEVAASESQQ